MKKLIIFIFLAIVVTALAVVFTIYSRYENFKKTPVEINDVTLMIEPLLSRRRITSRPR